MKVYTIDDGYVQYLKNFEPKVPDNKSESRPYIGVVLNIAGIQYYAPLTSPKPKHLNMKNDKDFRKIHGGVYGAINFNNMIPVDSKYIHKKDIANEPDIQYRNLLLNQLRYINQDIQAITTVAFNLRQLYLADESTLKGHDLAVKSRCCNFPLLEQIYNQYQAM